jgi:hypothetical protein
MTICFLCECAITDDDPATVTADGLVHDYCFFDSDDEPPVAHLSSDDEDEYAGSFDSYRRQNGS